jgi:hypothetical protein
VRVAISQVVDGLGLPLADVLRALIIDAAAHPRALQRRA